MDDYSRMTCVHYLKKKSETFLAFKRFKAFVEEQSGSSIKIIHNDRQAHSEQFEEFCKDEGIWKQLTADTVHNRMKSLNEKAGLLWKWQHWFSMRKPCQRIFHSAAYILNRCSTKDVKNKTPIETWSGIKPPVRHFRVFGNICYSHIPQRKKELNFIKKVKNAYLLGTVQWQNDIDFIILKVKK